MTKQEQPLEDPTNRVVAVLDDSAQIEAVRNDFMAEGFTQEQLRFFHGEQAASETDTSAKWFADTDQEIKRYQSELAAGNTVISVPVTDDVGRKKLHEILKRHDARMITHFGEWVIEMMK